MARFTVGRRLGDNWYVSQSFNTPRTPVSGSGLLVAFFLGAMIFIVFGLIVMGI